MSRSTLRSEIAYCSSCIHKVCSKSSICRRFNEVVLCSDFVSWLRGRLYSSCVRSSMFHGSETWPVRKENEVALQQAQTGMVRWMSGMKLQDRVWSKGLKERLGLDDIMWTLQQYRLRWCGQLGMWCKKKTMTRWRNVNVRSMKWRVPGCQSKRKTKENMERDCGEILSGM